MRMKVQSITKKNNERVGLVQLYSTPKTEDVSLQLKVEEAAFAEYAPGKEFVLDLEAVKVDAPPTTKTEEDTVTVITEADVAPPPPVPPPATTPAS